MSLMYFLLPVNKQCEERKPRMAFIRRRMEMLILFCG